MRDDEAGRPGESGPPQIPNTADADGTRHGRRRDDLTEATMRRFWPKVQLPAEPDGCALWIGRRNNRGYGHFHLGDRYVLAHRIAVMWAAGEEIPSDLVCDHLCGVRSCVAVSHIELITVDENTARGNGPTAAAVRARIDRRECLKGHDLSEPGAWLVNASGRRRCRECAYEWNREYRARNAGKANASSRAWKARNAEKVKAYNREYYARKRAERAGMLFDLPAGGAP